MNITELINQPTTTIIDVRTPNEFSGGRVINSINIPLNEVTERLEEIKQLSKPLVLCCAAGARSGQAVQFLTQNEVECYNGGSWMDVNFHLNKD